MSATLRAAEPADVCEAIRLRLASLSPTVLQIDDDSARHKGHAGAREGGGHYRLYIVSDQFGQDAPLARHRRIYTALGDMMNKSIHALAIHALTVDEAKLQPTRKES